MAAVRIGPAEAEAEAETEDGPGEVEMATATATAAATAVAIAAAVVLVLVLAAGVADVADDAGREALPGRWDGPSRCQRAAGRGWTGSESSRKAG